MIEQLERAATSEYDKIDSVSTSCVAVADDVAPCATAGCYAPTATPSIHRRGPWDTAAHAVWC